jgi:CRP/FNR family transcriptional regulator
MDERYVVEVSGVGAAPKPANRTRLRTLRARGACADCRLLDLCFPACANPSERDELCRLIHTCDVLERGEPLYLQGDPATAVYVVKSGCIKAFTTSEDGQEQILGFYLPGEFIGLDGIAAGQYSATAVGLERTNACSLPLNALESKGPAMSVFLRHLLGVLSREIARMQRLNLLLSQCDTTTRVEAFLLDFACRLNRLGLPNQEFRLSMSRREIGNYIGIAPETVSRSFTQLEEQGLISVRGKHVRINDVNLLRRQAGRLTMH